MPVSDPHDRPWFPAKRHGWGWGWPSRWQGKVALLVFVVLLVVAAGVFPPGRATGAFAVCVCILSAALVALCWLEGERPR